MLKNYGIIYRNFLVVPKIDNKYSTSLTFCIPSLHAASDGFVFALSSLPDLPVTINGCQAFTSAPSTPISPYPSPSFPSPSSSPLPLDFTDSDQLRARLGSMVISSRASLQFGVQLSRIETHPLC